MSNFNAKIYYKLKYFMEDNTMKSLGIVRRVDELGRIVLPKELRVRFDIAEKDALEIYTEEDKIILKKYEPACIFCGNANKVVSYKGKNVCPDCVKELNIISD